MGTGRRERRWLARRWTFAVSITPAAPEAGGSWLNSGCEGVRVVRDGGWGKPPSLNVGLFTDLTLYAEALQLAEERGTITSAYLQQELSQRLLKLLSVERQSMRVAQDLVRELRQFGWVRPEDASAKGAAVGHVLTEEGALALAESRQDRRAFRRRLAVRMHQVYVVPGWFVARLWRINEQGQGEVILPAPLQDWQPRSRPREQCAWGEELATEVVRAARAARAASPNAFPIADAEWTAAVKRQWTRLSNLSPRGREPKKRSASYRPRERLAQAMRAAALGLLFDRVPHGARPEEVQAEMPPLYPRKFMAWCPRLEVLEFIFYTDRHPAVNGRLVFPTAVFRPSAAAERFEAMPEIVDPEGIPLWLHQPKWSGMRDVFWQTLRTVHRGVSLQVNSLYVSLLDVRDEVCRRLRLSGARFDDFLSQALRELPRPDLSVSVESDIREEQRSGSGLLRRPVYIGGIPHTLIAVAHLPQPEGGLA